MSLVFRSRAAFRSFAALVLLAAPAPAFAADDEEVPYWAALRANEVNLRVGPAETYRINWVYRRAGLPMKVLRRMEGWRLVQDPDGARGWMLARFLKRDRGAIVKGQGLVEMREKGASGKLLWRLEPGVSGRLGDCDKGWCRLDIGEGHAGYVPQDRLWGVGNP
jgi:SH3-like domain-containing protein